MSLLLLFNSGAEAVVDDGFEILPDAGHDHDSYKVYSAMKTILTDPKDPSDIIDRMVDWAGLLGSDTISSSMWHIPDGITGESSANTSTTTTVWVSGGTVNVDYNLVNRIVTDDGRRLERYVIIPVREL